MAEKKTKKKKRFSFELGVPGCLFVLGLLLCLFLWMFILGFWLGQKMLSSKAQKVAPVSKEILKTKKRNTPPLISEEIKVPKILPEKNSTKLPEKSSTKGISSSKKKTQEKKSPSVTSKPKKTSSPSSSSPKAKISSFYTLQVASFRSPREAEKYSRFLRNKGYEAFIRKAALPKKGIWYRVYIGQFPSFKKAKEFGARFQKKEKIKNFYIVRLGENS